MTPTHPADTVNQRSSPQAGAAMAQTSLALLRELEASLESTQQAVLARDLAGLEQGTREQLRLRQELEILWAWDRTHPHADPTGGTRNLPDTSDLMVELRAVGMRVLHLGRVQAALLVRAQRSLRMIAHLLAGPESSYSPGPLQNPRSLSPATGLREESPCRV